MSALETINAQTDLTKFTVDEIIARLPEKYHDKLRERIEKCTKSDKKIRVYCDGVFDLFHTGHARLLEQVKKMLPNVELVVGVSADADVMREKGIYVLNEQERVEAVKHCKWTDEVHFPCPWVPSVANLKSLNCDFTAHDAIPYGTSEEDDCYKETKEAGMFLPTLRSDGISTSDLISRILRDRGEYVKRSIKKGITPTDLDLDLFECFKFGIKPPQTNIVNKAVNYGLNYKIVGKFDFARSIIASVLCGKKNRKIKIE